MIEADGRLEQLKQKTKDEAFKNSSILASRINKIPPPKIGDQVLEQLKRLTQGGIPRALLLGYYFINCFILEINLSQNASNRMSEYRCNNIFNDLDLDTLSAI